MLCCLTVVGVLTTVSSVVALLLVSVAVVGAGDMVRAGIGIGVGIATGVCAVDTGAEVEVVVGMVVSDSKVVIRLVMV